MLVAAREDVRLAEVLGALSVVTDLARGHPPEEAMRACLLATHVGKCLRLPTAQLADVYYATLLRFVGCTATSSLLAQFAGDDVAVRRIGDLVDTTVPSEALGFLWSLSQSAGAARPFQMARLLLGVKTVATEGLAADCEVGARLALRFGFSASLEAALLHAFERWDGHGVPRGVRGDSIPLATRLATLGFAAIMFEAIGDRSAAIEAVRRWSGRIIDPDLAQAFLSAPDECLAAASPEDNLEAVVACEPGPPRSVSEATLEAVAAGFGDMADLKSAFLVGHSQGVARLAEGAAREMNLPEEQVGQLRRAALLHDIGRVGVSTAVWDKTGRLSRAEWENVRLHPYLAERILSRSPALRGAGRCASRHHERLGGGGYPAGLDGPALDLPSRILAAADVYHALREDRPHRGPRSSTEATTILQDMSSTTGGGLDRSACNGVLAAAGERAPLRPRNTAGLTERELEVLQHLARGVTEREIAERLTISKATAHTHIVHIYEKAGVSTRAGVTMFALENQLLFAKIN